MTPEEKVQIEHECSRLSLEFARLNDAGRYEELVELFTLEGVFRRPLAPETPLVGRRAILEAMRSKPAGLSAHHVCTNILVDVASKDQAEGLTYFTVYLQRRLHGTTEAAGRFNGAIYVGTYRDSYLRTAQGWKLEVRTGNNKFYFDDECTAGVGMHHG